MLRSGMIDLSMLTHNAPRGIRDITLLGGHIQMEAKQAQLESSKLKVQEERVLLERGNLEAAKEADQLRERGEVIKYSRPVRRPSCYLMGIFNRSILL